MYQPPLMRRLHAWVPPTFWVAAFVQTGFLVALVASDGYDVARDGEVGRVILTYLTLLAMFGLVHLAVPSPKWSGRLSAAMFVLFTTVNFARYETTGSFDYGFAHHNFRELFTPLGRHIVFANVQGWELGLLLVFPLLLGFAGVRFWPARPWQGPRTWRILAIGICLSILVGIPAARASTHESLTSFALSALRYHAESRATAATIDDAPYPLIHEFVPSSAGRALAQADAPRPHVILLFMESWSAAYADRARPNGVPYTPVFDAKRREGLTFDHFYGNSVQSSRGHFATLCSLIPLVRGKEFVDLPDTRLHCLPEVLRESGYATAFHSATDDPDFDYADKYFARIGFEEVRFARDRSTHPEPAIWGVGIQDDVFYERFFSGLDEKIAREPNKPQFAVLANASHHYPFDKNPNHLPDREGSKYRRNYTASLSASDAWLKVFFDELGRRPALANTLVVLVGDHSFPADEHGIHFNGLGAFEEAFHTGFALQWSGHIGPRIVSDRAASQIDIAPTILDLLQLQTHTHFVGKSLVADDVPATVPLVQPYDGVRLAAVRWPLKLVRHESADQEQLYDLQADPNEEHDRIHDHVLAGEAARLRETFVSIHASEAVLRANRVWPER